MSAAGKHIVGTPTTQDVSLELESKKLQLHWLLQITKAINYNFTNKQLLDVYEHVMRSQLKLDKLALLVNDGQWKCALMYGTDRSFIDIDLTRIIDELNHLHRLETEKELWIKTFETILPIYHKDQLLAYALTGGLTNSVLRNRSELMQFIQTITNLIVVAIENTNTSQEKIRQAGIRKELDLARQMQNMLFPVELPTTGHVDIHATYLPHQEIGGDYYDYIRISDHEFIFCMADVSGKGIPAALLMSNFQANLHALVHHVHSLDEMVQVLNRKVYQSAKGEKFITFFIGRYNSQTRELHYVNAGHNPPFLLHEKVVYLLNEGSTGLGMFEDLPFINRGKVFIPYNAMIHCYTDGVTDVENPKGVEFGFDRLKNFFISHLHQHDLPVLHHELLNRLQAYKEGNEYTDDITLLSCRFR